MACLRTNGAEIPLPITVSQTLTAITSADSASPHLTHSIRARRFPTFELFGYDVEAFLECWPSAAIIGFTPEQTFFPDSARIGPPVNGASEMTLTSLRLQYFREIRQSPEGSIEDWAYVDFGLFGPTGPFEDSVRSLTDFTVGFRFSATDGSHYGWIHFHREIIDFRSFFQVAAHDWNPIPNAPISAGQPPDGLLKAELSPRGLRLSWPAALANSTVEVSAALGTNASWQAIGPASGTELLLPAPAASRFYRLQRGQ